MLSEFRVTLASLACSLLDLGELTTLKGKIYSYIFNASANSMLQNKRMQTFSLGIAALASVF